MRRLRWRSIFLARRLLQGTATLGTAPVNLALEGAAMALRVSGKGFDLGESLRDHVNARVDAATGKYFDGQVNGHVVVEHEGAGYRADCTLHLSSGITLHAEGRAHEPYASFDQAAERLEKRLRRYKRRLKEHHAGDAQNHLASGTIADYTLAAPDREAEEVHEFNPVVVAERTASLKSLAVADAVLDLELSGAPVMVFRHKGNGRVNIVYRRGDGNIGWIDPSAANGK